MDGVPGAFYHGEWSMTISSDGKVDGSWDFGVNIPFASLAPSGCRYDPPTLYFVAAGGMRGVVQGSNAVATESGTESFTPDSETLSCTDSQTGFVTSTREDLPALPSISQQVTFPLGKMLNGSSSSTTAGGIGMTYTLTKAPTQTAPKPTPQPASPPPPAVPAPPQPIPTPAVPSPNQECRPSPINNGSTRQICFDPYLAGASVGSATTGAASVNGTFVDPNAVQSFDGKLTPSSAVATGAASYASMDAGDVQVAEAPHSIISDFASWLTGSTLNSCTDDPLNCAKISAIKLGATAGLALGIALTGHPVAARLVMGAGIYEASNDATGGAGTAATVLSTASSLVVPAGASQRQTQSRAAQSANLEIAVTTARTSLYDLSGRWLVIDRASGKYVILGSGEELAIPKVTAQAAKENLPKSVNHFTPSAVKQWWETAAAPPTTTTSPASTPTAAYTVQGCWSQYSGGSWSAVKSSAASTTFTSTDLLQRGLVNFWSIVALKRPPSSPIEGTTATLEEPNGTTFATSTLGTWPTTSNEWEVNFNWTFSDGSAFFQKPQSTGQGTWTIQWHFPDNQTCTNHVTVSTG